MATSTNCIFFPASKLPRGLEVDAKKCKLGLFILANVLDRVDMEWDRIAVNGQDYSLRLLVDVDLWVA